MKYKKGDKVRVWSLQSWGGGGFINGSEGYITQDQIGSSVMVALVRKKDGIYQLDTSYEVYAEQCKPMDASHGEETDYKSALKKLREWVNTL